MKSRYPYLYISGISEWMINYKTVLFWTKDKFLGLGMTPLKNTVIKSFLYQQYKEKD